MMAGTDVSAGGASSGRAQRGPANTRTHTHTHRARGERERRSRRYTNNINNTIGTIDDGDGDTSNAGDNPSHSAGGGGAGDTTAAAASTIGGNADNHIIKACGTTTTATDGGNVGGRARHTHCNNDTMRQGA